MVSLEEETNADELARRAYRSRAQFFRVFGALIEETPAAMRRRLLLERAGWQLGRTGMPVTEIAFDAHYGSLEAFTRAFSRAFKISPSLYRRMGATHFHLPAPNAIHFCAPAPASGGESMDLYDIFAGAESFHVRKLLEHARRLTDAQLDKPLEHPAHAFPWEGPAKTPSRSASADRGDQGSLGRRAHRRHHCPISTPSRRNSGRPTRCCPGSTRPT